MKVFQHILGTSPKPDWEKLGFDPQFRLITTGGLWRKSKRNKVGLRSPDEVKIRQTARKLRDDGVQGCIDIEHWGDKDRYIQVADIIRDECPGLAFGFYNVRMPIKNYWTPVRLAKQKVARRKNAKKLAAYKKAFKGWQDECAKWRIRDDGKRTPGDAVHVIYCSVYDPYQKSPWWREYAEANLAEAKKFHKPIVACICPEATDRRIRGRACTEEMMTEYLEVCSKYADSVFVFRSRGRPIDIENQPWWPVLQDFSSK